MFKSKIGKLLTVIFFALLIFVAGCNDELPVNATSSPIPELTEIPIDSIPDSVLINPNSKFSGKRYDNIFQPLTYVPLSEVNDFEGTFVSKETLLSTDGVTQATVQVYATSDSNCNIYVENGTRKFLLYNGYVYMNYIISTVGSINNMNYFSVYISQNDETLKFIAYTFTDNGVERMFECNEFLLVDIDYFLPDDYKDDNRVSDYELLLNANNNDPVYVIKMKDDKAFACDISSISGCKNVNVSNIGVNVIFECSNDGQYPSFYVIRDDSLIEIERSLAVYEDFIIPDSDIRQLDYSDLQQLTVWQLSYARNEILARHGCIFEEENYNEYFAKTRWYVPDSSFNEGMLSSLEVKNILLIYDYEKNINNCIVKCDSLEVTVDLEQDGSVDLISVIENVVSDTEKQVILNVNDSSLIMDSHVGKVNGLYICDVDNEKKGYQILVSETDSTYDHYAVSLYGYSNNEIIFIDRFDNCNEWDISIDGTGRIFTRVSGNILQNFVGNTYTKIYSVIDNTCREVPQSYYPMKYITVSTEDIKLYAEPDNQATVSTINPGQEICLCATDDVRWIMVQTSDGRIGWIFIENNMVNNEYYVDLLFSDIKVDN